MYHRAIRNDIPSGIAARIHASTGMGKVIIDPKFTKVDDHTFQSPDCDSAVDKIEITIKKRCWQCERQGDDHPPLSGQSQVGPAGCRRGPTAIVAVQPAGQV